MRIQMKIGVNYQQPYCRVGKEHGQAASLDGY